MLHQAKSLSAVAKSIYVTPNSSTSSSAFSSLCPSPSRPYQIEDDDDALGAVLPDSLREKMSSVAATLELRAKSARTWVAEVHDVMR